MWHKKRTHSESFFGCEARASHNRCNGSAHVTSQLNLILGAIALSFNEDGLHVVCDPVQQRRGEHRIIVKNTRPMLINPVGGDQRGAPLIAMADDLKQTIGAKLINLDSAKFSPRFSRFL